MSELSIRLKQARLACGLTQDETIARLPSPLTKAALSNYEHDKRVPHARILHELAGVYRVSVRWLLQTGGVTMQWHAFRAKASMGERKKEKLYASMGLRAEQEMRIRGLFPEACSGDFPKRTPVKTREEVDEVAAKLRKRWRLGTDALESATQCLENRGAVIVHVPDADLDEFDGLSATINHSLPLLVVNPCVAVDRLRFDLLHELGHVLMDASSAKSEAEEEKLAHRFASSFLVPPETLKRELGQKRKQLTLSEVLVLKEKYGLSVAAWIYAAHAHGVIARAHYQQLFDELEARDWRKTEPVVFEGNEKPARLRQLALRAVSEGMLDSGTAIDILPDLEPELKREGLMKEHHAKKLLTASKAERDRQLRLAAERMTAEYAPGGSLADMTTDVAEDILDER